MFKSDEIKSIKPNLIHCTFSLGSPESRTWDKSFSAGAFLKQAWGPGGVRQEKTSSECKDGHCPYSGNWDSMSPWNSKVYIIWSKPLSREVKGKHSLTGPQLMGQSFSPEMNSPALQDYVCMNAKLVLGEPALVSAEKPGIEQDRHWDKARFEVANCMKLLDTHIELGATAVTEMRQMVPGHYEAANWKCPNCSKKDVVAYVPNICSGHKIGPLFETCSGNCSTYLVRC